MKFPFINKYLTFEYSVKSVNKMSFVMNISEMYKYIDPIKTNCVQ